MAKLIKDSSLFERDGEGGLIGREVILETLPDKPTVTIKPLTRGQIQKMRIKALSGDIDAQVESDNEIIREGLVSPKYTDEEIKVIKPKIAAAIAMAIMAESLDVSQTEVNRDVDKLVNDQEAEIKKKL